MKLNPFHGGEREVAIHLDNLRVSKSQRIANYARAILFVLLGIAAVTFSARARAADVAWMPNQAGGEIVLTTEKGSCSEPYLLAYSRGDDGTVITGCWLPGTRAVLIRWSESGTIKMFGYEQFTTPQQAPASRPAVREFGL